MNGNSDLAVVWWVDGLEMGEAGMTSLHSVPLAISISIFSHFLQMCVLKIASLTDSLFPKCGELLCLGRDRLLHSGVAGI
jgi:hypothetical protein